jgi:hypothetical protein
MRTMMMKNDTSLFKAIKCPGRTSCKCTAIGLIIVRKFRLLKLKDKYKNQTNALLVDVQ